MSQPYNTGWCRGDWKFLTHDNILHNKKWNKIHPFYVQGEQFITLTGNILKVTSIICKSLSWAVNKTVKTLAKQLLYMANTTRTAHFSSCIVCVRLFYTHYFKYPDRNKSGTVRSGDCTGHGITNTQKYSLSLINTGNIHTDQSSLNGFSSGTTSLTQYGDSAPLPPSESWSAFWNISVGCATPCIK